MGTTTQTQKEFNEKLEALKHAFTSLSLFWEQNPDIECGDYPEHWTSFDNETIHVIDWHASVIRGSMLKSCQKKEKIINNLKANETLANEHGFDLHHSGGGIMGFLKTDESFTGSGNSVFIGCADSKFDFDDTPATDKSWGFDLSGSDGDWISSSGDMDLESALIEADKVLREANE